MVQTEIGDRLRFIRKSKGLSIYKLSQETGISQNHFCDLEHSRRKPSVETLKRLIVPLGITMSEFFNEDGEVSILTDNERELIENYRTLSSKKAEALLTLSRLLKEYYKPYRSMIIQSDMALFDNTGFVSIIWHQYYSDPLDFPPFMVYNNIRE